MIEYRCESCDQLVKEYPRSIYAAMAKALIALYWLDVANPDQYHHITDLNTASSGGDFAKMRYWGLIIEKPLNGEDKRTSGFWAITQTGRDYVEGKVTLPKYCNVIHGIPTEFTGSQRTIVDALGKHFSYFELMSL